MIWTVILASLSAVIYIFFRKYLNLLVIRKVLGITLFLELFYLIGHYISDWPFPSPYILFQILIVVALGVALGVTFSRIWPLSPKVGFERVIRTLLLVIPSMGLGIGLQVLMQGNAAQQAIYLIFSLSAWLGSGHFIRRENNEKTDQKK